MGGVGVGWHCPVQWCVLRSCVPAQYVQYVFEGVGSVFVRLGWFTCAAKACSTAVRLVNIGSAQQNSISSYCFCSPRGDASGFVFIVYLLCDCVFALKSRSCQHSQTGHVGDHAEWHHNLSYALWMIFWVLESLFIRLFRACVPCYSKWLCRMTHVCLS